MGQAPCRRIFACCVLGNGSVHALPIAVAQQAFADQLSSGQYFYPIVESGPNAGRVAVFQDSATAFAGGDGLWRALLKGAAVVAGGVAGSVAGPGGTAVGALATAMVVNEINRQGPGPGRFWLVADARIYRAVDVAGVGDILPSVLATAQANIVSTFTLNATHSLAFVDASIIGVHVKDASGVLVDTIDLVQAFVLTSTEPGATGSFFGTVVLNTVNGPGDRPLTPTDLLDVDVGPLLTAPDGTPVTMLSTLIVGATALPEPGTITLLGIGVMALFSGQRTAKRRRR